MATVWIDDGIWTYEDERNAYSRNNLSEMTINKEIERKDASEALKKAIQERLHLEPEQYDVVMLCTTYEFDMMDHETGEIFPVDYSSAKIKALKRYMPEGKNFDRIPLENVGEMEIELDHDIAQDIYEEYIHSLFPYMPAE